MNKFVVLLGILAVVIQTTHSLSVYEQWLRDIETAEAAEKKPIQSTQSRQTFMFPTKKQNPGLKPLRPVVVTMPVVPKPVGKKSQESKLKRNDRIATHLHQNLILQSAQNMRSLAR